MSFFDKLPEALKVILEVWSIELLVLVIFFFQSFLCLYGDRRRYSASYMLRAFVWSAYQLSAKFPTVILGKLTSIPLNGDTRHTRSEILALLAPFILMLIGNPDALTAYSIEDDELGARQIFSLVIQIGTAILVIFRSWTSSLASYLSLALFLAGIIKYGEAAWALKTALNGRSNSMSRFLKPDDDLSSPLKKLTDRGKGIEYIEHARLILTAYQRFFQLKPHLENWLHKPLFKSKDQEFSIYQLKTEEIFTVTDSELGFMYDVLYTKAPIVYSPTGFILRIISFSSLIATLCGVIALFQDAFIYDVGVGFIYFVLAASVILETFQILLLPFSDWVIVMMVRHDKQRGVFAKILKILSLQSKRRKRWSNSLEQFNLLSFCLIDRHSKISRWSILRYWASDMMLRKLWNTTTISINSEVKELIVREIRKIDAKRNQRPFVKIGKWTTETHGIKDSDLIKKIFGKSFDKCIITWHLATDMCYYKDESDDSKTDRIEAIRMISNYMMCFLAKKPCVLGPTIAAKVLDRTTKMLKELSETGSSKPAEVCEEIRRGNYRETASIKGWGFLKDVKDLVERLEKEETKWEIIGRGWIEMMCYAASNCKVEYHAEHLWQGGELMTHVWLILAHNTDRYFSSHADEPVEEPTSAV